MAANPYARVSAGLVSIMRRLRDKHPDMTIMQAQALFTVAAQPGITQIALARSLDTSDSAASRIVAMLTEYGSRNTEGMDLVEMQINRDDRRERLCHLTAKGKRLLDDVLRDLGG